MYVRRATLLVANPPNPLVQGVYENNLESTL